MCFRARCCSLHELHQYVQLQPLHYDYQHRDAYDVRCGFSYAPQNPRHDPHQASQFHPETHRGELVASVWSQDQQTYFHTRQAKSQRVFIFQIDHQSQQQRQDNHIQGKARERTERQADVQGVII